MIRWECLRCKQPGKYCKCLKKRKIKLIPYPATINCRLHDKPWKECDKCSPKTSLTR